MDRLMPSVAAKTMSTSVGNAVALLLVVGSLLSVSVIFAKAAPLVGWSPLALLQWSMLGGAIIQILASGVWRAGGPPSREILFYALVSGILFALPNALAFAAALHVGAGFVALCFAFPLVLTYGMAVALRLERFERVRFVGVVSGLVGGILLASGGGMAGEGGSAWVLAALSVPVVIAIGNIFRTCFWPEGAKPIHLSIAMTAVGFAVMLVLNLVLGVSMVPAEWTAGAWLLLGAETILFAIRYDSLFSPAASCRAGLSLTDRLRCGSRGAGSGLCCLW